MAPRLLVMTVLAAAVALHVAFAQDLNAFLAGIQDPSADVRAETWKSAGAVGAPAVAPLAELLPSAEAGVKKAILAAWDRIAMHAGRPGAEEERKAVAAEFGKLLDPAYSNEVRREVLPRLGLIGADTEVDAIAKLIETPELAQDAIQALDRMPTQAAIRALGGALLAVEDTKTKLAIVGALARRRDLAAGDALMQTAQREELDEVSWACLEAAARLGVMPNYVFRIRPDFTASEKARYVNALLEAAHALVRQGNKPTAERAFLAVSSFHVEPYQAGAALIGLAEIESPQLAAHALGYLLTPGIHEVAYKALLESKIPQLDNRLADAFGVTRGPKQAAILQLLAARGAENLGELLPEAKNSDDAVVRVTARQIAGEESSEEDLFEVASSPLPWFSESGVDAYLGLADAKLAQGQEGETATAVEMYEKVASNDAFPVSARTRALGGLEKIARQSSLRVVEPLAQAEGLEVPAGRARLAIIAAQDDKEKAKTELLAFTEQSTSQTLVAYALELLDHLGVRSGTIPLMKGYLTKWMLLGPFPNKDGSAFERNFVNPAEADGRTPVVFEGTEYTWKEATSTSVPALFNLLEYFSVPEGAAVYAFSVIQTLDDTPVVFRLGTNDGCELWLNGERLHAAPQPRELTFDEDKVEATLKRGENKILLKVLQEGGAWGFCMRVTHPDGSLYDLTKEPWRHDGLMPEQTEAIR